MENRQYTIEELCEITGYTRRTIRYYIQEGILDPPAGRGRGGFYFDSHLEILRRIKTLQESGLKISEIRKILLKGEKVEPAPLREVWIRYPVEPGIEIHISKELDEGERKKVAEIIRVARTILKGGIKDE
ncbi:MAG: MerR family transcriptional regulator [Deltaproteobacteria bacterium]|nr:MerR family transcriptional regulator [Deltaproteobacteria bacterium]